MPLQPIFKRAGLTQFRYNENTMSNSTLTEQLERLSESKAHMVSDAAREARLNAEDVDFSTFSGEHTRNLSDIELFNEHVKLLVSVLKHTRFDEFVVLIGQPQRFIILSFISGLTRGLGFALGALIIGALALTAGGDIITALLGR